MRPPRLGGNTRIGVFASRSPFRPNDLALSCVNLKEMRISGGNCSLIIGGADMLDSSPVYDIKPYIAYTDCIPNAKSGFAQESKNHALEICGDLSQLQILPAEKQKALLKILADDPRPAYQDDENRIYGFAYAGYEIKFRVKGTRLELKEIAQEQK